jgi:hypothetical protein
MAVGNQRDAQIMREPALTEVPKRPWPGTILPRGCIWPEDYFRKCGCRSKELLARDGIEAERTAREKFKGILIKTLGQLSDGPLRAMLIDKDGRQWPLAPNIWRSQAAFAILDWNASKEAWDKAHTGQDLALSIHDTLAAFPDPKSADWPNRAFWLKHYRHPEKDKPDFRQTSRAAALSGGIVMRGVIVFVAAEAAPATKQKRKSEPRHPKRAIEEYYWNAIEAEYRKPNMAEAAAALIIEKYHSFEGAEKKAPVDRTVRKWIAEWRKAKGLA